MDRNKFIKNDYVVLPTTKNPAYKAGKYTGLFFVLFIILVTCINF